MTNYVYIAQSIDGYIAGPNGELDWLDDIDNPENNDFGFAKFMNQIDALVMGKNTFEKVQSFGMWPYSKPVYIASSSLNSIPEALKERAYLINSTPSEIVSTLNEKGLTNLYIDGGLLIQSFLTSELIDKFIITTIPVLLGKGVSLFGWLDKRVKLKLESSEVLVNQLVKSEYSVIGKSAT